MRYTLLAVVFLFCVVSASASIILNIPNQEISTLHYDILTNVMKEEYHVNETVVGYFVLVNKENLVDSGVAFTSFYMDPNGTKTLEENHTFESIKPGCPNARYNEVNNNCFTNDGDVFEPERIIILKNMTLPFDAQLGEWKLGAVFTSQFQKEIILEDSFDVVAKLRNISILAIIGLMFIVPLFARFRGSR